MTLDAVRQLMAFLLVCVTFEVTAIERLILISDIDDTLKASDIVGLTNAGLTRKSHQDSGFSVNEASAAWTISRNA